MNQDLPDILRSYPAFQQWIEGQLDGLLGHDKGDPWQEFSRLFLGLTEYGKSFHKFKNNPRKTRDHGWDIQAVSIEDDLSETLYVQAKYKMPSQNDLDGVISGFVPLAGIDEGNLTLPGMLVDRADVKFVVTTISDLHSSIIPNYLRSGKPSVGYYKQWSTESRIEIIDGPKIWQYFRDWYLKSFSAPKSQKLNFVSPYTHFQNVYIGIVDASERSSPKVSVKTGRRDAA